MTPRVGGEKASVTHLEGDTLEKTKTSFWAILGIYVKLRTCNAIDHFDKNNFRTLYAYCMGSKHIPLPVCMFKGDFPFPQVGYVSCLEGMATSRSHDLSLAVLSWETFPFHICPRDVLCPKLRRGEGPVAEVSPRGKVIAINNMFRRSSPALIKNECDRCDICLRSLIVINDIKTC